MSKFTIEVDIPDPPPGYGSPEWGVWEDGCLLWKSQMGKWSNVPIDGERIICRPLPPPVQYRDADIKKDWGESCEFSDDGNEWSLQRLVGHDPGPTYPWMSVGSSGCVEFWTLARIAVKAGDT